jgi:acyl-coenzyme A synthetase/AMP-(fatty) acid ligase
MRGENRSAVSIANTTNPTSRKTAAQSLQATSTHAMRSATTFAEGYYIHGGRTDDMIKAGGIWVSPVEVEATLIRHPAVMECAVIAVVDEDGLEKPQAFVKLRPGVAADEMIARELRDFVKGLLAPYKCPRTIRFIDEIPKTATGKVKRFELRKRAT